MLCLTRSKFFLYFCLSFAIGILIASFLAVPVLLLFAAMIISTILISIFWREKKIAIAGLCVIFLAFGVYRFQSVAEEKSFISQYNDLKENIIVQGVVSEEPDVRIKDTQYIVEVKNMVGTGLPRPATAGLAMTEKEAISQSKNLPCEIIPHKAEFPLCGISQGEGKILVTLPHYPLYQYGDLVELGGKVKTPAEFDAFSYKDYLAKDGIYSVMYSPDAKLISSGNGNLVYSAIFRLKDKFKENLKSVLPEPENSLLAGLLLGERSGLSQETKDDFSVTGTSHVIAVSGFNVTIIAVIILELALMFGFTRGQSFWISLAAIILFIVMVGAPASAVRAGIMGGLVLVAIHAGRLNSMTNAITFAAVAMMAMNPKILRFDAGFELSFLAVIGLVWLYPVLEEYFLKIPDTLKIKTMLLVTISAQTMALPVLLYDFDRLSLISPVANILILPLVPLAMALGFLAGTIGFFWLAAAKILGYFTWIILMYQIRAIEYLADLSWASISLNIGVWEIVGYYAIVGITLFKNQNVNIKD